VKAAPAYIIEDQRRMMRARNYFAWQASLVRPELGRRVVEFGCGIGNFTAQILDRDEIIALDADAECVAILQKRYPQARCFQRDAGAESLADLAQYRPDSCLFINVLEHVRDDVKAVRDAADLLPSGGAVIIYAPAFPALFGPIDRHLNHYRRYTKASIRALAAEAGLRVAKLHYVNIAGFFGWWANARLWKLEAQSETQIEIFDRCIVPVLSRMERAIPPPFGQNIFAVLRRD
jgi:SAM-dependent methyltransferase